MFPIQSTDVSYNCEVNSRTKWKTIGYSRDRILCEHTRLHSSTNLTIAHKYGTLPEGSSGGPLIMAGNDDHACGIRGGMLMDVQCQQDSSTK